MRNHVLYKQFTVQMTESMQEFWWKGKSRTEKTCDEMIET